MAIAQTVDQRRPNQAVRPQQQGGIVLKPSVAKPISVDPHRFVLLPFIRLSLGGEHADHSPIQADLIDFCLGYGGGQGMMRTDVFNCLRTHLNATQQIKVIARLSKRRHGC